MPEMQEQFPAIAMDGVYAGNAGAISGDRHGWRPLPAMASEGPSRPSWPSGHLGSCPSHSGSCPSCMPEMQEQFPFTNVYGCAALSVQRFRSNVRPD